MDSKKYMGMDVHKEAISIAVLNASGKLVMESIIATKAITIVEFMQGLRGELHVTFEEGTWSAWLYDLLKPHVQKTVVCDPRRNALLKDGSKSDRIDARKLAQLLDTNMLRPVYHGESGVRTLKELARSYLTISKDQVRVMTRLKALYRSWAIPCSGKQVYAVRHRAEWLDKIREVGVRRRAEFYYQQLDALRCLRREVRRDLLTESAKHRASKRLRQIPSIGPIRAALLIAILQTPIASAPSDNSGPIAASGSKPTTVESTATSMENCADRRRKYRFVGSIEITITISRTCSRVQLPMRRPNQAHSKSFTQLCWSKEFGRTWHG